MTAAARRHSIRAALDWLEAKDPLSAELALGQYSSESDRGQWRELVWLCQFFVQTRLERWSELPPAYEDKLTNTSSVRLAIARELANQPSLDGSATAQTLRSDFARGARLLRRLSDREHPRPSRVCVAAAAALVEADTIGPSAGHVARELARALLRVPPAAAVHVIDQVIGGLDAADGVDASLAVAVVAIARGHRPAAELLARVVEAAADGDHARPYGTWVWEWRLAAARARAWAWDRDPFLTELAEVVTSAQGFLESAGSALSRASLEEAESTIRDSPQEAKAAGEAGSPASEGPTSRNASLSARQLRGYEVLSQVTMRLQERRAVETVLREVAQGVRQVCEADSAVVLYREADDTMRALTAKASGVEEVDPASAEVSRSAIRLVREGGEARVFDDAVAQPGLAGAESIRRYRPRALMVAPLRHGDEVFGCVYVENRSAPRAFEAPDLALLECFAAQAAVALENAALFSRAAEAIAESRRVQVESVRAEGLRLLGQMTSEVAHEFNNLLAVIQGEAQFCLGEEISQDTRESLTTALSASRDAATVIERIRDGTHGVSVERLQVSVTELIGDSIAFSRPRYKAASVTVENWVSKDESLRGLAIRGSRAELREVVVNLLLNAADACPAGGTVTVSALKHDDDTVEIVVSDDGEGMSLETAARVFEPFFTTKQDTGTGLGLSVVKRVIEAHDGRIFVESELGVGTQMHVVLPTGVLEPTLDELLFPGLTTVEQ